MGDHQPGWYPVNGRNIERYYDGSQWTDDTRPLSVRPPTKKKGGALKTVGFSMWVNASKAVTLSSTVMPATALEVLYGVFGFLGMTVIPRSHPEGPWSGVAVLGRYDMGVGHWIWEDSKHIEMRYQIYQNETGCLVALEDLATRQVLFWDQTTRIVTRRSFNNVVDRVAAALQSAEAER